MNKIRGFASQISKLLKALPGLSLVRRGALRAARSRREEQLEFRF